MFSFMDNLITHLENTLNDDECVKEALLLLKNLEGIPKPLLSNANNNQSQSPSKRDFEQLCNPYSKSEYAEKLAINPQLVAIFGLTSFLKNDFQTPNELPVRVVAFRLGVPFDSLRKMCCDKSDIVWPATFFDLCLKIIECFELAALLNQGSSDRTHGNDSMELTRNLKSEIEDLKTNLHPDSG